jgi:hypothetical protein
MAAILLGSLLMVEKARLIASGETVNDAIDARGGWKSSR